MHLPSEHVNILSKYQHLRGEVDNSTTIAGDLYPTLNKELCSSKQKSNRETWDLNYTFNHMDPAAYRTFHPTAPEHTSFPSMHGAFSRISHEAGFNEFKIKIIPSIFSDHIEMKLEVNYSRKTGN